MAPQETGGSYIPIILSQIGNFGLGLDKNRRVKMSTINPHTLFLACLFLFLQYAELRITQGTDPCHQVLLSGFVHRHDRGRCRCDYALHFRWMWMRYR